MTDVHLQRSDSEPGVDTVGEGTNRECVIWIRFDHWKLDEKASLPHLREDASISETCALEESASHHFVPWRRLLRTMRLFGAHPMPPV